MKPRSLAVEIEALVLHGFAPGDRHRVAAAVQRELERLFRERGVPPALTASAQFAQLGDATIQAVPGSRSETIGRDVARAVYSAAAGESNVGQ
ncbi:MAG: hypothetical protein ACRD2M_00605 [Terriglobales bacterium]